MIKLFASLGAIFAALGVVLGAFAAHALKNKIQPEALSIFEVGVRYQMYHALGLLALALFYTQFPNPLLTVAGFSSAAGILLFSGSLYLIALTGIKTFGAITPVGGLFFILSWILLFVAIWQK